jgi:hypothetical protein
MPGIFAGRGEAQSVIDRRAPAALAYILDAAI